MALVINLHGPNTNTLGNLTAGALAEIGYSAVAVPSCRREMELAALSGNEQAIRLTDGSLESCVELASMQAERNQRSIDPDLDAVIVCGPVVDSFWGYKATARTPSTAPPSRRRLSWMPPSTSSSPAAALPSIPLLSSGPFSGIAGSGRESADSSTTGTTTSSTSSAARSHSTARSIP